MINRYRKPYIRLITSLFLLLYSCGDDNEIQTPSDPEEDIYRIPVVVHILHKGEPVGEGYNISKERIVRQIETLNEDFRRKAGTRGSNNHPDGADAKIEFELAKSDPEGQPTDGIVRLNSSLFEKPTSGTSRYDYYATYSYWDYERYLNIWVEALDKSTIDIILGEATGPDTDLPGHELLLDGEPLQAEGILISSFHFGESDIDSDYNLGRTLTHEVGHYLGLLHPWGSGDCTTNDYCADTPAILKNNGGCPSSPPSGCSGELAMIENYMDYTADRCMNIFTNDQVARMHYLLNNNRKKLVNQHDSQTQ